MRTGDEDVALTLIHTADWHLGKRFPSFSKNDEERLTRARFDVLERIFGLADQYSADAVLCAGDLFDEPEPPREWWEPLAARLAKTPKERPIFLLPGNHDPLRTPGVWDPKYGFRERLPAHVIVVDRPDFTYALKDGAVLHAVPCTSKSGQQDPTLSMPARGPGDQTIRIGLAHGSTYDAVETHFPIGKDSAERIGLDYLAIGDTHGFRIVPPDARVPTVYPGAPEPTNFGEVGGGTVALVFVKRSRRVHVEPHKVAYWTWERVTAKSLGELRDLALRTDLGQRVLSLKVEAELSPAEYDEAERILGELSGTGAVHPKVGILELDRTGLRLDLGETADAFRGLPEPIRLAAEKIADEAGNQPAETVSRALYHLYKLARSVA